MERGKTHQKFHWYVDILPISGKCRYTISNTVHITCFPVNDRTLQHEKGTLATRKYVGGRNWVQDIDEVGTGARAEYAGRSVVIGIDNRGHGFHVADDHCKEAIDSSTMKYKIYSGKYQSC